MPARAQELSVAYSFRKQTNIGTASILANIITATKLEADPTNPGYITEDDAAETGKGHEFPTAIYPSHIDVGGTLRQYASSEMVAWASCFALGSVVKSGGGPYIYTVDELNPVTDGMEIPYFTYLEAMRQGGSPNAVFDRMYVGCAVNAFRVIINNQPGRAGSVIEIDWVGSGDMTIPSGITHPSKTTFNELPGSSIALTVVGVDYITTPKLHSATWGWTNNLTKRWLGGGLQDGYAKAAQLLIGNRVGLLQFVVDVDENSLEYTKLLGGTTGTAIITQTKSANETYTATFAKVGFKGVTLGSTDGIATVAVDASVQYSSGVLGVVATTAMNNICQAPA